MLQEGLIDTAALLDPGVKSDLQTTLPSSLIAAAW